MEGQVTDRRSASPPISIAFSLSFPTQLATGNADDVQKLPTYFCFVIFFCKSMVALRARRRVALEFLYGWCGTEPFRSGSRFFDGGWRRRWRVPAAAWLRLPSGGGPTSCGRLPVAAERRAPGVKKNPNGIIRT